jgi:hypothetical protein
LLIYIHSYGRREYCSALFVFDKIVKDHLQLTPRMLKEEMMKGEERMKRRHRKRMQTESRNKLGKRKRV